MIFQMAAADNPNRLLEAIKACQAKVKAFIAKKAPLSAVSVNAARFASNVAAISSARLA